MGGYLLPFNHSGLREITAVYISVIGSMDCVSLNSGDPRGITGSVCRLEL